MLTAREREIARMIVAGGSCKSIARTLGIAVPTVRKHRENLMRKLQVSTLGALVVKTSRFTITEAAYDIEGIAPGGGDRQE
jgi:DNA-binding CsgD family transcriptional regulator